MTNAARIAAPPPVGGGKSQRERIAELRRLHPGVSQSALRRMVQAEQRMSTNPVEEAQRRVAARDLERAKGHELKHVLPKRLDRGTQVERYHARRSIDGAQLSAAQRLAQDFAASGFDERVTGSYEASSPGADSISPGTGPRAAEYIRAMRAAGFALIPILHWVVLEDKSAESWALSWGKPHNDGMGVLRIALDELCYHYRMKTRPFPMEESP